MLVLDTHALYWWVNQTTGKLSRGQIAAIEHQAYLLSVDARFPDYVELGGLLVRS